MKAKYYLKAAWQDDWTEVSRQQFVEAERSAGFRPKPGCGPVATAGFSDGTVSGRVVYVDERAAADVVLDCEI